MPEHEVMAQGAGASTATEDFYLNQLHDSLEMQIKAVEAHKLDKNDATAAKVQANYEELSRAADEYLRTRQPVARPDPFHWTAAQRQALGELREAVHRECASFDAAKKSAQKPAPSDAAEKNDQGLEPSSGTGEKNEQEFDSSDTSEERKRKAVTARLTLAIAKFERTMNIPTLVNTEEAPPSTWHLATESLIPPWVPKRYTQLDPEHPDYDELADDGAPYAGEVAPARAPTPPFPEECVPRKREFEEI